MKKMAIKNEQTALNAAISGIAAHDSVALEKVFEKCRTDKKKMTLLVRAFCECYLIDKEKILVKNTLPTGRRHFRGKTIFL